MQIGKKTALYGYRQCIHDVQNLENASKETMNDNKSGMNRESGKNTDCPAELNFSISTACATICVNKTTDANKLRNEYSLEITLHYNHNHAIDAADASRYRPVSFETKKIFDIFDEANRTAERKH